MRGGWVMLVLLGGLAAPPAEAASGWDSYGNARFGYEIAVPPGFVAEGEAANGDGQRFRSPDGSRVLAVWGGYLVSTGFGQAVADRLAALVGKGWTVTYKATTPGWASVSATRGQRVIYWRDIVGCRGDRHAAFEFDYPSTAINAMKPVVEQLVRSLRQARCD